MKQTMKKWLAGVLVGAIMMTGSMSAFAAPDPDPAKTAVEDHTECNIAGHMDMTYDAFKTAASEDLKKLGIDLGALSGIDVNMTHGREYNEYSVIGMSIAGDQGNFIFNFDAKSGRIHNFTIMQKKYENAAAQAEVALKHIGFSEDEIKDTMTKLEKAQSGEFIEVKEISVGKVLNNDVASIRIQAKPVKDSKAVEVKEENKPQCVKDIEGLIKSANTSSYPVQFDMTYAELAGKTEEKLKKEGFDYENCSAMYKFGDYGGQMREDAAVYAYTEKDKVTYRTEIDYEPKTTKINYIQTEGKTPEDCIKKLDIFLEALGLDEKTRTTAEDASVKAATGKNTENIDPIPAGDYVIDVKVSANGVSMGIGKEK